MSDAFDMAEFFTTYDPDELSHSDPGAALDEWVERWWEPGLTLEQLIDKHAPVEVVAYNAKDITSQHLRSVAIDLRERVYDNLTEEFGDMDGELPGLTAAVESELQRAFEADLVRVLRDHGVRAWQCERVATREYSAEELHSILCQNEHCESCSGCIPDGEGATWADDVVTCRPCTPTGQEMEELKAEAAAHDDDRELPGG